MHANLPAALGKPRSERMLEGAFNAISREEGNEVGYDTLIGKRIIEQIGHRRLRFGIGSDSLTTERDLHITELHGDRRALKNQESKRKSQNITKTGT